MADPAKVRKRQQAWWSRLTTKYPQLLQQYGQEVPLDESGKIPNAVFQTSKDLKSAETPIVRGRGTPLPGQQIIEPPAPVDWSEVGRDLTSGAAGLLTAPLNFIPGVQQGAENIISGAFGEEPRDFDIPEDAGFLRTIADPIMPTLQGLGTGFERFLDPVTAATWQAVGPEFGTGYEQMQSALREAGYGPSESTQAAYAQADIDPALRFAFDVLAAPEELIPGFGIYAGGARAVKSALGTGRRAPLSLTLDQYRALGAQTPEQARRIAIGEGKLPEFESQFGEGYGKTIETPDDLPPATPEDYAPELPPTAEDYAPRLPPLGPELPPTTPTVPFERFVPDEAQAAIQFGQTSYAAIMNAARSAFSTGGIGPRTMEELASIRSNVGDDAAKVFADEIARLSNEAGEGAARATAEGIEPVTRPLQPEELAARIPTVEEPIEQVPTQLPSEWQLRLDDEVFEPFPSVPAPTTQAIPTGAARTKIDDLIEKTADTDSINPNTLRREVQAQGTSPSKTRAAKIKAQGIVRSRFDSLVTGNLNEKQATRAAEYVAKHTGITADEAKRLASEAAADETFGARLSPEETRRLAEAQETEDLLETVTAAIEPTPAPIAQATPSQAAPVVSEARRIKPIGTITPPRETWLRTAQGQRYLDLLEYKNEQFGIMPMDTPTGDPTAAAELRKLQREYLNQGLTPDEIRASDRDMSEAIASDVAEFGEDTPIVSDTPSYFEEWKARRTPQTIPEPADVVPKIKTTFGQSTRYDAATEKLIDDLLNYRQEGKHNLRGFKSHYGTLKNRVTAATGMTDAEVEEYIQTFTAETRFPPVKDPKTGVVFNFDVPEGTSLASPEVQNIQYRIGKQGQFTFSDVSETGKGLKSAEEEMDIAVDKIDNTFSLPDETPSTQESIDFIEKTSKAKKDMESSIRQVIQPDEIISGEHSGRKMEGLFKPDLVRKYEGGTNALDSELQDTVIKGNRLFEALGFGERVPGLTYGPETAFRLTLADIGTARAPGPIRILYYALHGEENGLARWISGDGMSHPSMAVNKSAERKEIYDQLREQVNLEQVMRVDFDPTLGLLETDYFYRGWVPIEGANENIRRGLARLLDNPSYRKQRGGATFAAMDQAGFRPLHWNPFEQMVYSHKQSARYRLQDELVNKLHAVGQAEFINEGKAGIDALNTRDAGKTTWRVPKVGPAFEGKGAYKVTSDHLLDNGQLVPLRVGEVAVPERVAKQLEAIFKGGGLTWQKTVTTPSILQPQGRIGKHLGSYALGPNLNITNILDNLVFIPKRMKLFMSLFQATDFMRRIGVGGTHGVIEAIWTGIERGMTPGQAFDAGRVMSEASYSVKGIGHGWWDVISSYGAAGKSDYYRNLLLDDTTKIMEGTDITWKMMVGEGLSVRDLTILPPEDLTRMIGEIAEEANFLTRTGRFVKELEYSSRRGLFDRVYPAAIMTDVKYNLVPMAKRMYPNATDRQIAALVSKQANMKYSTLLRSESNVTGFFRETLSRTMFSVNENEALIRQMTQAIRGDQTAFWRKYWISAAVFFLLTASTIHLATTAVTEGKPRMLPTNRFVPWKLDKNKLLNFGYNNRFLSPDLPIPTRSGEKATLDMLGQLDTGFRMLDWHTLPLDSFITSRKGATAGALLYFISGKDFYGRETDKSGFVGRGLQFLYDIAAPIGAGEAMVSGVRGLAGDQPLPSMGSFIRPDTVIKDILPVSEQELGPAGILAEMTGENLKAPSNQELQRKMILTTLPDSDADSFRDLDSDTILQITQDERNQFLVEELEKRTHYRADMQQKWAEQKVEREDIKDSRMAAEAEEVLKWDQTKQRGQAFSSSKFRERISDINFEHRIRQDMVSKKYGEFPEIAQFNKEKKEFWEKMDEKELVKKKLETPLDWAEWRWYRLLDKYSKDFGEMDWKAFNDEFDAERATWGEELVARFDRFQAANNEEKHAPEVARYYKELNILNDAGYWGEEALNTQVVAWHEKMPKKADGTGLAEEWDKWIVGGKEEKLRIEKMSFYKSTIKILKANRSQLRYNVLLKDPELDRMAIEWFGRAPVHQQNIQFYFGLYGRPPSRLSSPMGVASPRASVQLPR